MIELSQHILESIYGNLHIEDPVAEEWVKTYNNQERVQKINRISIRGMVLAEYRGGIIYLPPCMYIENPDLLENGTIPPQFSYKYSDMVKTSVSILIYTKEFKSFDNFPSSNHYFDIGIIGETAIEDWDVPGPGIDKLEITGIISKKIKGVGRVKNMSIDLDISPASSLDMIRDANILSLTLMGSVYGDNAYSSLGNFFAGNVFSHIDIGQLSVESYRFFEDKFSKKVTINIWRSRNKMYSLDDNMLEQIYGGLASKNINVTYKRPPIYGPDELRPEDMKKEMERCKEIGLFIARYIR